MSKRNPWIPEWERWCVKCHRRFHADDLHDPADDWQPYQDSDGEIVENPAHVCLDCREPCPACNGAAGWQGEAPHEEAVCEFCDGAGTVPDAATIREELEELERYARGQA